MTRSDFKKLQRGFRKLPDQHQELLRRLFNVPEKADDARACTVIVEFARASQASRFHWRIPKEVPAVRRLADFISDNEGEGRGR